MKYRRILLLAVAALMCVCLSTFTQSPSAQGEMGYLVNENGQTYGNAQYADSIDTLPDLIHAGSVDGTDLYIYAQDLLDLMPKTQEEALDLILSSLPLYEVNGTMPAGEIGFCPELLPEAVRREFFVPSYPVNESGQTYGSLSDELYYGAPPELVLASGTNGETGYVYNTELEGPHPSTPEEAIAMQEARGNEPRYIPLYEVDGVTVIGEFKIG